MYRLLYSHCVYICFTTMGFLQTDVVIHFMTTRNFIFISLVILPFMASGQQNKKDSGKVIVQDVRFEVVEDDIEPPPPHLTSKFATLQDWLHNICDKDRPPKPIAKYKVGLFESPNDYTLVLVGVNTYDEGKNRSVTRIEFEPANMYFILPKIYYDGLNREHLLDKLTSQLKDFANTEKFKTSFFAKANVVVFETNGKTIWSR
jgi:hypothetical protein